MSKSNPIGVRFDKEKLELIKKEKNLKSPQQVLNFLMDNYHCTTDKKSLAPFFVDNLKESELLHGRVVHIPILESETKKYTLDDMPSGLSFFGKKQWKINHGL